MVMMSVGSASCGTRTRTLYQTPDRQLVENERKFQPLPSFKVADPAQPAGHPVEQSSKKLR